MVPSIEILFIWMSCPASFCTKWLWQWYCITEPCVSLPSWVQENLAGLWMDGIVTWGVCTTDGSDWKKDKMMKRRANERWAGRNQSPCEGWCNYNEAKPFKDKYLNACVMTKAAKQDQPLSIPEIWLFPAQNPSPNSTYHSILTHPLSRPHTKPFFRDTTSLFCTSCPSVLLIFLCLSLQYDITL